LDAILKLIPAPAWVTVKTPYGALIGPKSSRVFTMRFGSVEPEIQGYFKKQVREATCADSMDMLQKGHQDVTKRPSRHVIMAS
jgi:uncharacterized membrane protein